MRRSRCGLRLALAQGELKIDEYEDERNNHGEHTKRCSITEIIGAKGSIERRHRQRLRTPAGQQEDYRKRPEPEDPQQYHNDRQDVFYLRQRHEKELLKW